MNIIQIIALIGFFITLILMHVTKFGIRGLRRYDPDFRSLDMRLHYNADSVYAAFDHLGEEGRKANRVFWIIDYVFIICFLIVHLMATYWVFGTQKILALFIALAILRTICDILENTILFTQSLKFPHLNRSLCNLCGWITTCKFAALLLWIAGVVIELLLYTFQ